MMERVAEPTTECTGVEVIPTADGPEVVACLCGRCTGRAAFRARPDVRPDGFTNAMVAAVAEDEDW